MEIKDRFEQINSTAFARYIEEQKQEELDLDKELSEITSEVKRLELDATSSASTADQSQDQDEDRQ